MSMDCHTMSTVFGVADPAIDAVVDNLRPADRREVAACGVTDPAASVRGVIRAGSVVYVWRDPSNIPIALLGAHRVTPRLSTIWMLGTPRIDKHKMTFLRCARKTLAAITDGHERVMNVIDLRNALYVRWLKWMGFTITDIQPFPMSPDVVIFYKDTAHV